MSGGGEDVEEEEKSDIEEEPGAYTMTFHQKLHQPPALLLCASTYLHTWRVYANINIVILLVGMVYGKLILICCFLIIKILYIFFIQHINIII